jgi:hypothetical protein
MKLGLSFVEKNICEDARRRNAKQYVCTYDRGSSGRLGKEYKIGNFITFILRRY